MRTHRRLIRLADAQTDLSLRLDVMSESMFSQVAAHLLRNNTDYCRIFSREMNTLMRRSIRGTFFPLYRMRR